MENCSKLILGQMTADNNMVGEMLFLVTDKRSVTEMK